MTHTAIDTTKVKYADMVAALIKDGEDIRAALTPELCNILHMAVGVSGECGELLECALDGSKGLRTPQEIVANLDRENSVEESGDIEFYSHGLFVATDTTVVMPEITNSLADPLRIVARLSVYSSHILDAVKKTVMYGKPLADTNYTESVGNFVYCLAEVHCVLGVTRKEAREHNIDKLLTGEKARYKLGKFTNEQAQARADKDGAQ